MAGREKGEVISLVLTGGAPSFFYTRTETACVYEPLPGLDDVMFCLVHYFVIVLVLSYNTDGKDSTEWIPT